MADTTTKKEEVSKPPFDPYKLLNQLKEVVDKNKQPTKGGGKSWLGTLVIIAVVLVGVAVWAWISFSRGRELAKLRHEKNKAKILKEQTELFVKLNENDERVAEAQKSLDKIAIKLKAVDASIKAEEERYAADMRAIDSIRSWRDAGVR